PLTEKLVALISTPQRGRGVATVQVRALPRGGVFRWIEGFRAYLIRRGDDPSKLAELSEPYGEVGTMEVPHGPAAPAIPFPTFVVFIGGASHFYWLTFTAPKDPRTFALIANRFRPLPGS